MLVSLSFCRFFSLLISHIARYAPSSQEKNNQKYNLKLMQLIIFIPLNDISLLFRELLDLHGVPILQRF